MEDHIKRVCQVSHFQLRTVRSVWNVLLPADLEGSSTPIYATVYFDYFNSILVRISAASIYSKHSTIATPYLKKAVYIFIICCIQTIPKRDFELSSLKLIVDIPRYLIRLVVRHFTKQRLHYGINSQSNVLHGDSIDTTCIYLNLILIKARLLTLHILKLKCLQVLFYLICK